jgi:hypothetical protein
MKTNNLWGKVMELKKEDVSEEFWKLYEME